ncbi:S8 family serine peptidase [Cytobacillus gottheilii]|uniref:S8 family serine peptidase n=1 Tax=Cytobacillus gottheilii TaxID=859144 RepID=A0ABX8FAW6_9BACI|nr:S8 family serine peptidase [Cytobacillus gottheilii]QVY61240.1 S8 family serine peptidase [Cytobacillus gottheilii]
MSGILKTTIGGIALIRKVSLALLIFLMVFSSAAYGAVPPKAEREKPVTSGEKLESPEHEYNDEDEVRIIVELDGEAAVQKAQQQGKIYSELTETEKESVEKDLIEQQNQVVNELNADKLGIEVINNFTTVVNGFSTEVQYGKIKFIEQADRVATVHIAHEYTRPEVKPEMLYSKELVEAQRAWDEYGFKGEGMVVGVIDTGIDTEHRDMVLSEETEETLTKDVVDGIVAEKGLPGKYYTEKVPYAYNYMDQNDTILDLGAEASEHGMHVSGTVGANGDEENGGLKGVAPEAQILGLKVFGNDPEMPSTYSDIYVKAIDDAIKLGVDVINMSLGSTAAFVLPEDPEQKAVERAVESGVLMAISAGNSAHFGNGFANPWPQNPDIGVSGSPGISYDSLQVASYENSYMNLDAVEYVIGEGTADAAPFLSAGSVHPNSLETKEYELAYGGLGKPEELGDVEGKFALIRRGELDFVTKALNAQAAGALGVIVYNNADGYVNMASDAAITIPQLFMLKSDGDTLAAALQAGESVTIAFNGETTQAPNPTAGAMSDFTSWGVTPNLDFKPEITAPGGQILSTLQNNEYGMMSGTSMAAPHVAGGSALVLERVDNEFGLENAERVNMAKNILMNTAKTLEDKGQANDILGQVNPYSPRRQGAGLMQLHAALATPVVVAEQATNEAKVSLKEVGDNVEFTLVAKNYSDDAVSYDVGVNVQTDLALFGELGYAANVLEAQALQNVGVSVNGSETAVVELAAGEEKTIKVELDLTNASVYNENASALVPAADIFTNGYFVEGFVTLTDTADVNPELSVPYVGFKGEWDKAQIVDDARWTDTTFYGMTSLVDESLSFLGYSAFETGINPENIAFSPNGDGVQDQAIPVVSFLRNAKKVEYNILDSEGNKLRTIRTENHARKNYYDGGRAQEYSLSTVRGWDGQIDLKPAAEGDYQYEIRAVVDYPDAEWQSFTMPIKVDVTAPEIEASYDAESKEITFANVADNEGGSGVYYIDVLVDGSTVLSGPLSPDTETYAVNGLTADNNLEVVVYDFAGNSTTEKLQVAEDTVIPDVHVLTPEAFGTVGSKDVVVSGYVNDKSGIKELEINGELVEVVVNPTTGEHEFSTTISYETDGVKKFDVKTVDNRDNEIAFQRTVFVDSTAPTIDVKGAPASTGKDSVEVSLEVADNFDEIRVYNNGSEIFTNEFLEPYEMRGYEKTIEDVELALKDGKNTFVFEVTDLAGHKASKTVTIEKLEETPPGNGGGTGPIIPPTPPVTPPPTTDDGEAVLDVTEGKVIDQINDSSKSEVTVDLSSLVTGDVSKLTAKVGKDTFKKVADSKKGLVVKAGTETVALPAAVVADIAEQGSDNVQITIETLEAKNVPASKGKNLVSELYDFSITLHKDGKSTDYSAFAEPVEVTVSVDADEIDDARKTAAYYLNEDDAAWEYVGGKVSGDSFTFTVNHFSTYAVIENNVTFKDVAKHWAKDEVEVLASRSIINGKTSGSFAPEEDITRAQFAALLVRSLNLPVSEEQGSFKDVSANHWAASDIEAAYAAGIISGKLDGSFAPSENITREQMAAMLIRAVEYKDASLLEGLKPSAPFKDADRINSYAKEAIDQAVALKLLNGNSNGTFGPKKNTTRAQAAVVLYRMLDALDELK